METESVHPVQELTGKVARYLFGFNIGGPLKITLVRMVW